MGGFMYGSNKNSNNNNNNSNMSGWGAAIGAALGIGNSFIQTTQNRQMGRMQHNYEKKLMDKQHGIQRNLNEQGRDLSLDLWNKTNAGAQMEHLKEAGLNPALMYGKGGAGGTTSGMSGGSAGGGSAGLPSSGMLDIAGSAANIALIKAQAKNIEADTNLKEEQAGDTHQSGSGS